MKRWKYLCVEANSNEEQVAQVLQAMGNEGWILSAVERTPGGRRILYFRIELEPTTPYRG